MNKRLLIFLSTTGVLIVILFVLIFFIIGRGKKGTGELPQTTPIPSAPFSPTLIPPTTPTSIQAQTLKIEKIMPQEDLIKEYLPIQYVSFAFNFPVVQGKFFYTVDPLVETRVTEDRNIRAIVISVPSGWKEGITTITVLENTESVNGLRLEKPVVYKISTAIPTGGE